MERNILPYAIGAILGACVGDAAGAPLENLHAVPTQGQVKSACHMCGGGSHRTANGQVTDDGELTLSMARGLVKCGATFNLDEIAKAYVEWLASNPFDAGTTTFDTIGSATRMSNTTAGRQHLEEKGYANVMKTAALKFTVTSKSNGCLMRASPLGVWAHDLSDEEIAAMARADCSLTNPNDVCQDAVASYCIAIASLVNIPEEKERAYHRARDWVLANGCEELKGWLQNVEDGVKEPYHPQAGFVKIAWTHTFRHLKLGTEFEAAIVETLSGGGDTDTNACIVGGMMGAFWGTEGIPSWMKQPVLECDTRSGRPRPEFLSTRNIPTLAQQLLNKEIV